MLCRNCNYILSGKENFCPNCGTIPLTPSQAFPNVKKLAPETTPSDEEKKQPGEKKDEESFIFTETDRSSSHSHVQEIFIPDDDPEDYPTEDTLPRKHKKTTSKIFLLLFLCCALATASFVLADYFGIMPELSVLTGNSASKNKQNETSAVFTHADTVLHPETDYPMTTAYILSGNGLTLRKGPGNGYAPLHNLTDLTKVQIFGGSLANTNWLYVYCGEKECYGWLDGSYLCSEEIVESELTSEYASIDDIPTAYYNEAVEDYSQYE